MNIFIDTNIFLAFLHYTKDELEELKKLTVLLSGKHVRLFLPEQVVDEFNRNREAKVADALKRLAEQTLTPQLPQFCKDYPEYETLREAQRAYAKLHAELLRKVTEDALAKKLKADSTIQQLFELAEILKLDDQAVQRARTRAERGNPPGKNASLGDGINWELLLHHAPDAEDLFVITDDRDYSSPLGPESFSVFLREEWRARKFADVVYFRSLSDFFRKHFPQIKLASDWEKDLLIGKLAASSNFAETHQILAKLGTYSDFSVPQRNAIVSAATTNNQVSWIVEDSDVRSFLFKVVLGHENEITEPSLNKLLEMLELLS